MAVADSNKSPRLRLGLYLWIAGMLGVVALTIPVVPQLVSDTQLSVPLSLVLLVSVVQSALLLALAVWLGVVLAPKVGLQAAAFEAAATGGAILSALRPQVTPGLVGGVIGGIGLFAMGGYSSPTALAEVEQLTVPVLARVLYGGVTEELLLRWGLMTLLLWMAWRFLQRHRGAPQQVYIWFAVVVSALLFGAGHLPAMAALVDEMTVELVVFIVGANSVFGVLFGYLYWRFGLEAAMISHALAHIVSYALSLVVA